MDNVANQYCAHQRDYIDHIMLYANVGINGIQKAATKVVEDTITADETKTILKNTLSQIGKDHNAIVYSLQGRIKAASSHSTAHTNDILKEMLRAWQPPAWNLRSGSRVNSMGPSLGASAAPSPVSSHASCSSGPEPSSSVADSSPTPDEMMDSEALRHAFLYEKPAVDEIIMGLHARLDFRTAKMVKSRVKLEDLIQHLNSSILEPYLSIMQSLSRDTVQNSIQAMGDSCKGLLEEKLREKEKELANIDLLRQDLNAGGRSSRVVKHLLAWGNLIAARQAMDILYKRLKRMPRPAAKTFAFHAKTTGSVS